MKILLSHSLLLFLLLARSAFPAACCGSSSQLPSLITTDDRWQASGQLGYDATRENSIFKMDGTWLFAENLQASIGVPTFLQSSEYLLGDVVASLAYEILPEYTYSPWRPRIFLVAQTLIPTGHSNLGTLVKGVFQPGVGLVILKAWKAIDVFIQGEIHKPFDKQFTILGGGYTVSQGIGSSATAGIGFSPNGGNLRFGINATLSQDADTVKSGAISLTSVAPFQTNFSPQISYLWSSQLSTSLNYSTLNCVTSLALQYRLPQ